MAAMGRRCQFKDRAIQAAYDQHRAAEPTIRGGIANAYWKGREHPDAKSPFPRNSLSYGAWCAVVDAARESKPR